jgi:hypothetical protein
MRENQMTKPTLTKNEHALKDAIDQAVLFASRRMTVMEELAGKSDEYRRGFFDGAEHESNFVIALLAPCVEGLRQSIDEALKAQGIEP